MNKEEALRLLLWHSHDLRQPEPEATQEDTADNLKHIANWLESVSIAVDLPLYRKPRKVT